MRLVDIDALMESFENVLGAAPCELNGYEIWEVLNAQEPIDAIPMDWMDAQIRGYASRLQSTELKALLIVKGLWEKDQEAKS